jgi:hypothetical protein
MPHQPIFCLFKSKTFFFSTKKIIGFMTFCRGFFAKISREVFVIPGAYLARILWML